MPKVKLPAMPFYIGDWKKAPEVQALPLETRAVWWEMLLIMWESDERGCLVLNKTALKAETLASMIGCGLNRADMARHLSVMETFGVYSKRESDGVIFCRWMVKHERIRKLRSYAGKKGGNPALKNSVLDNQIPEDEDVTEIEPPFIKIDDIAYKKKDLIDTDGFITMGLAENNKNRWLIRDDCFQAMWQDYPNKAGKKEARRHFMASVKTYKDWENIQLALGIYKKSPVATKDNGAFIMNGSTFFNNWEDWKQDPKRKDGDDRREQYPS